MLTNIAKGLPLILKGWSKTRILCVVIIQTMRVMWLNDASIFGVIFYSLLLPFVIVTVMHNALWFHISALLRVLDLRLLPILEVI